MKVQRDNSDLSQKNCVQLLANEQCACARALRIRLHPKKESPFRSLTARQVGLCVPCLLYITAFACIAIPLLLALSSQHPLTMCMHVCAPVWTDILLKSKNHFPVLKARHPCPTGSSAHALHVTHHHARYYTTQLDYIICVFKVTISLTYTYGST